MCKATCSQTESVAVLGWGREGAQTPLLWPHMKSSIPKLKTINQSDTATVNVNICKVGLIQNLASARQVRPQELSNILTKSSLVGHSRPAL